MKVIHHEDEHLLCLSSDEVALLVDLCHAGACSDLLPASQASQRRLKRFLGEVQTALIPTAQALWRQRHPRRKASGEARLSPAEPS